MTTESEHAPIDAPAENRVSVIVGDRLCIDCGYNLVGQSILREQHYDLLIARCPECGAVAALQEYPMLGRWANRWAAVLAGLWLLVTVVLWAGCAAAIFGFSVAVGEIGSEPLQDAISQMYSGQNQTGLSGRGSFNSWYETGTYRGLFQVPLGRFGYVDANAFFLWLPLGFVATLFGVMWSVILTGKRYSRRVMFSLILIGMSLFYASFLIIDTMTGEVGWTSEASLRLLGVPLLLLTLGVGWLCLLFGLWIGPLIARWLVRTLLPPRLLPAMNFLWLNDGLEPPTRMPR